MIYSLSRGGAERATVNLSNYLVSIGWEVDILTIKELHKPAYQISNLVTIRYLGLDKASKSVLDGCLHNVERITAIRRYLKAHKVDCLIGMGSSSNILVSISCFGLSVCAIGSERSHPVNKPITLIWKLLRKYVYRLLDSVICLTSETQEWMYLNTFSKRVTLVPNGVDYPLRDSDPTAKLPKKNSKKIILGVGRLIDTKQFDQLIVAYTQIAEQILDWDLVILGDGPEKQNLNKLVKNSGLENRIHLPGAVGNLHYWYSVSDMFVSTSRHEGFPNSLLEAMAYSLPVVAYDCSTGPRDLIEHNRNGMLLDVSDVPSLINALVKLINEPDERQKMATLAGSVNAKLSMDQIGGRWVAEVNQCVTSAK